MILLHLGDNVNIFLWRGQNNTVSFCFLFKQQSQAGIAEPDADFRFFIDLHSGTGQGIAKESVVPCGGKFHGAPKLQLHALRNDIALPDLLLKEWHVYTIRKGRLIVELLANVGAFGPITAIRTMQPPIPLMDFILQVGKLPAGGMSYINSELNKIPKE